ncbi:MAG: hypothetical protein J6Q12_09805 [Bacteroidales bacterium]|nr:hypothetical protein [Bacteroidales bacterium]
MIYLRDRLIFISSSKVQIISPALKYLIVCLSLFCSSCSIFENDIDENEDALINEDYYLDFIYANPKDSLSSVMLRNEGIAGINATYESESVYIKDDGIVYSEVDWEPDHLMFWKHDGVIFGEGRKIGIAYGGRDIQPYECREFPHRQ